MLKCNEDFSEVIFLFQKHSHIASYKNLKMIWNEHIRIEG